jgi:hypothetical protein
MPGAIPVEFSPPIDELTRPTWAPPRRAACSVVVGGMQTSVHTPAPKTRVYRTTSTFFQRRC